MQQRAQALEAEINKLREAPAGTPIDQRSLQAKIDQLEQLKKDIQRKAEDAQASYDRRRNELFGPLQEEIGKALEVFAKARGINVIIDGARVPLLYAAESIDITKAFIQDFNAKNPVTAALSHRLNRLSIAIGNLIHGNSSRFTGDSKASAASLSFPSRRPHC